METRMILRTATAVLCISQSLLTLLALDKRQTAVLRYLQVITKGSDSKHPRLRMHRFHQGRHMLGRRELADAVA